MSFCGILHWDDRPVDTEVLGKLARESSLSSEQEPRVWVGKQLALAQQPRIVTPESTNECLPAWDPATSVAIVASARLDDRDGLCNALGLRASDALTDSDLIVAAYHAWNEDCVTRLLGSYAFAIWDSRRRALFCARDPLGSTPIFYAIEPGRRLVFSTKVSGLLTLGWIDHSLDEQRVGQFLVRYPVSSWRTFFRGVSRLQPAHAMTVTANRTRVRRYWFPENVPLIRYRHDSDYLDHFRELFERAVDSRLRTHRSIGIALSGGLDSGAVAVVAARALARRGKTLHALTVAPHPGFPVQNVGDESTDVAALERVSPGIEVTRVDSPEMSPVSTLRRDYAMLDTPGYASRVGFWTHALSDAARDKRLGVLLWGKQGNTLVSWFHGAYYAALLMQAGPIALARAIRSWRALWKRPLSAFARARVVAPLLPDWLHLLQAAARGAHPMISMSPISARLLDRLDLAGLYRSLQGRWPGRGYPDVMTMQLNALLPGRSDLGDYESAWGDSFDGEVRDPTADVRLLEFCLGLPIDQHVRDGWGRALIRRAFAEQLPARICWRQDREPVAPDALWRMRSDLTGLRLEVVSWRRWREYTEFVDVDRLLEHHVAVQENEPGVCQIPEEKSFFTGVALGRFMAWLTCRG